MNKVENLTKEKIAALLAAAFAQIQNLNEDIKQLNKRIKVLEKKNKKQIDSHLNQSQEDSAEDIRRFFNIYQ